MLITLGAAFVDRKGFISSSHFSLMLFYLLCSGISQMRPFRNSSNAINNAKLDPSPLPWIFMPNDVHLTLVTTSTCDMPPSWTEACCMPEESDYLRQAPTSLTCSAWWFETWPGLNLRLRWVSIRPINWKRRRSEVATTSICSAAEGNIPRRLHSAEQLHCWAIGISHSGLPLDALTELSVPPVHNLWVVQL